MWILVAAAAAHPVGDRAATQTSSMVVYPDHVDVDYFVDVPVEIARSEALAELDVELRSGLLLVVDGRVVSMTERAPAPPPEATAHTVGFALHLTAPLPAGARAIALQTSNLQEAANFYAGDVHVAPTLRVEGCSLLATDGRRILRDDTLRWRRGDENRALAVTLADPVPAWWSLVSPPPAEAIRARAAFLAAHPDPLDPGTLTPAVWLATVALAAGLGAAVGRGRVLATGLAPIGIAPVPAVAVGLGALVLGAASRRWGAIAPIASGIGAAALIATVGEPRAALLAAVVLAGAGRASPGGGARLRAVAWLAVAALVVARSGLPR